MIDKRLMSGALAALALALMVAGPARAIDAACMWRQLPPERQAAMLEAVGDNGARGGSAVKLSGEADIARWKAACDIGADQWAAAGRALGAFAGRERASRDLADLYGVDAARMEAAWSRPAIQALLPAARKDMAAPGRDPTVRPPSLHQLTMTLYRELGLTDGVLAVFGYSYNRVMLENAEAP